jgi:hypothetical protein
VKKSLGIIFLIGDGARMGSRCFGYKLYYWWLKIHKSEEDKNPDVSVGGKIKIEGLTAF